ncbi:hypothetical protein [Paraburkholderia nodosa]|uniref:hypothetical protein n=1 Tax=Paraburkholderia nodosa TaxID=392320 RepID=UPI00351F03F4
MFALHAGNVFEVEIVDYPRRCCLCRATFPILEILSEQFTLPMDIAAYRLAKEIGVEQTRIGEIVSGRRAITVDTGLHLSPLLWHQR